MNKKAIVDFSEFLVRSMSKPRGLWKGNFEVFILFTRFPRIGYLFNFCISPKYKASLRPIEFSVSLP